MYHLLIIDITELIQICSITYNMTTGLESNLLAQSKAQMGMWCMLAAPLIMSNDLRTLRLIHLTLLRIGYLGEQK